MPKWDKNRNYYADLEVASTASTEEIKKQFRKLALKYHPDRNPGREVEVQSKFQIIQSAHEILTDETLKKQYDDARRTRYPAASGVKGNPWQDAAKSYPPPPRRQNNQTRPASGAQRYESFTSSFAGSMPRHTRPQTPKDDPQFRRSNADAWEQMRPSSARRNPQAPPQTPGRPPPGRAPTSATRESRPGPAPVPPRTAYQKQKAQAAFGTSKKTGFTPSAPGVADEPPVTNKNYFTTRTHSYFAPDPASSTTQTDTKPAPRNNDSTAATDPLGQFKEKFMDERQSTPYHTPGGEKTSLFDRATGLGRSASTRMPRAAEMPGTFPYQRPRSSSPARSSSNDGGSEDSTKTNSEHGVGGTSNRNGTTTQPSRASERYRPKTAETATNNSTPSFPMPSASAAQSGNANPSGYAQQIPSNFRSPFSAGVSQPNKPYEHTSYTRDWISLLCGHRIRTSSSEDKKTQNLNSLLPLEMQQRTTLDRLVSNHYTGERDSSQSQGTENMKAQHKPSAFTSSSRGVDANNNRASSFYFAAESKNATASADAKSFARNSTDNINTRFVDDEIINDWQFKAGSVSANEATEQRRPRSQPRNRPVRRPTPLTNPFTAPRMPPPQEEADSTNSDDHSSFSAGKWSEQIGPQHFEPQPMSGSSTSPNRRPHLNKSRSFRTTAEKATAADEEERDEPSQASPHPPRTTSIAEEDAMDIDSPPPPRAENVQKPAKVNSARKYSTEPYRAEWRAGDANGVPLQITGLASSTNGAKDASEVNGSKPAVNATFPSQNGGSEDSEEFRTTFADFTKVEPFAEPRVTGLKSWGDLKSTLPFQSQPSEQVPSEILNPPRPVKPLKFPTIPVAPRVPPSVAGARPSNSSFRKYAQDFNTYMEKWEAFEDEIISHLTARQTDYKTRRMGRGANWLEGGVANYLAELDQDIDVQRKYGNACLEHRKRVAEYMDFRDRVN